MPLIRSLASMRCVLLATSISLDGKIISPYSYYTKKGLVCVVIMVSSSCQPSFCFKCIKANTRSLCDVRLVSTNEYIF